MMTVHEVGAVASDRNQAPRRPPVARTRAGTAMIDHPADQVRTLEPVQAEETEAAGERWAFRLVLFLRTMAVVAMVKGLYHWAVVCGIYVPGGIPFEDMATPYQAATVFFSVIDLVAAVGLWLAAPWGAVVWLTSVISMAAVEVLFPQIYGGRMWVVAIEVLLLGLYLALALMSAREQPA
jgi:hypothetical protein